MEAEETGRVVSPILVSPIAAGAATAADGDMKRETLRGLKGVQVLVEGLSPELNAANLDATMVQSDVELQRLARLEREPKRTASGARTWSSRGTMGTSGTAMLTTSVRDTVKDKVDEFIRATCR